MNFTDQWKQSGITLVGLTGRKGSGKSTFAAELAKQFPFHVNLSFADPIRSVSLAIFGSAYRTHEEKDAVDSYWEEKLGADWSTGRKVLQHLGTEVFRNGVHKKIWVYVMERRMLELLAKINGEHPRPLVTIDDIRYGEEAEFVRELGGNIIRMVNTNHGENTDQHPSEAGIKDDYVNSEYAVSNAEDVAKIARAWAWCFLGR